VVIRLIAPRGNPLLEQRVGEVEFTITETGTVKIPEIG
jgi:hypothetical protein